MVFDPIIKHRWLIVLALLLLPAPAYSQATNAITLNPGLASTVTVYNPGTQVATTRSILSRQLFYEAHTASCTINSTCGAADDSGKLITATAAGVTFTVPAAGPIGPPGYSFGYDGAHTYTITAASGIIYGACGGGTSSAANLATAVSLISDGTYWQCVGGSGTGGGATATVSYGNITSTGTNSYTMSAPVPTVSLNTAGYVVCGSLPATPNTGDATLAVGTALPLHLRKNIIPGGLGVLVGGEIPGVVVNACFEVDSTATYWVLMTLFASGISVNPVAHAVTQAEFNNGAAFLFTTSQTLTLPNLASVPLSNAGITVMTVGTTLVLQAQGTDVINTGQVGASTAGGTMVYPSDTTSIIVASGTPGATAYTVPLGPVQYFPFTWLPGQNLAALSTGSGCSATGGSTAPCGFGFGRVATPRVLYAIHCTNYALVGGIATLDFFAFVPGSTVGSGTHLNSTSFNANSGTSEVSLTLLSNTIPANYDIGVVPIGGGWSSSSLGGGMCQASYR